MKLVAALIAALSLISTTYAQGQHTYNGRKPEPMQTTNDIRMVAPALEKYAQGPLADLWKRPGLTPRERSIVTLRAKDVGHLESGPSHFSLFRLKLRLMFSVLDRERLSSGFVTACKCRCDRCKYWAVVSRSPCPSRSWMVRRSVPASNKWVAQLWRRVCGVTRLLMPARRAASLHAIQTVLSEIG